MAEGREGDWECSGCRNRNYAFRSFCNRCRQPRLLVDSKTPADSKWLPRIGDWICTGCTNNNYASREKCKKCGQNKDVASMPAIAMPGSSVPSYPNYLGRGQVGLDPKMMSFGAAPPPQQQPFPLNTNWPGADKYGVRPGSGLSVGGIRSAGAPYANPGGEVPKGFRSGDWICGCGFHNYQSRTQCKKCNAFPPALGIKRLASEEFVNDWDNKRLNVGHAFGQHQAYPGFEQAIGARGHPIAGPHGHYPGLNSVGAPNFQAPMPLTQHATTPTLFGKGAKQWRNGDWMCTNCDNHNYASRSSCNRCKTERDAAAQPVNVI
ncbi:RNA-binding protein involved in heterochromatin assembly dri1 [Argentina anserina]|uniref:RNA-binding protein involved in heterochromatin assembly dri1 n=1 Tax=Argentina anserina TaxID=57926 RepID=UPI0021767828|nr:RNA-binding protein involved in heterochromatin assembly dri1 [Potentilla anserina]